MKQSNLSVVSLFTILYGDNLYNLLLITHQTIYISSLREMVKHFSSARFIKMNEIWNHEKTTPMQLVSIDI